MVQVFVLQKPSSGYYETPVPEGFVADRNFWSKVRESARKGYAISLSPVLRFEMDALKNFLLQEKEKNETISIYTNNLVFLREYEKVYFPDKFKEAQKWCLIVDMHNIFHRAYHGLPYEEIKGVPSRLVTKSINIITEAIRTFGFRNIILVTDSSGTSFRRMFALKYGILYKKREVEEQLMREIRIAESYFRTIGIPLLASEGMEADDIAASIAAMAVRHNVVPAILSSDKDFLQLADRYPSVLIKNPWEKREPFMPITEALRKKMPEVPQGRVLDYMSIVGDQADGIPGAKGIGHAGALKILSRTTTFEQILADEDIVKKAEKSGVPTGYLKTMEASRKLVRLEESLVSPQTFVSLLNNSFVHPNAQLMEGFPVLAGAGYWKNVGN